MELECVESLGPDTLAVSAVPEAALVPPRLELTATAQPSSTVPIPLDFTDAECSTFPTPYHSDTLSPLTCTPTSSPKRRRNSYVPQPASATSPAVLQPGQPLRSLATRDVDHAVRQHDHLADTPVTPAMREEVVAWCSDMTEDFDLPPAIAAIAVNLFDRFLIRQSVSKNVLYPLTASCLLLACKITVDDDLPLEEISTRSRVALEDIYVMESIVLNVLSWRVHVVTPHEVAHELALEFRDDAVHQEPLLETLLLNSLLDYRFAWLRATSIGFGCFILATSVATGDFVDYKTHPAYVMAKHLELNLGEIDYCITCLEEGISSIFSDVEECESEGSQY